VTSEHSPTQQQTPNIWILTTQRNLLCETTVFLWVNTYNSTPMSVMYSQSFVSAATVEKRAQDGFQSWWVKYKLHFYISQKMNGLCSRLAFSSWLTWISATTLAILTEFSFVCGSPQSLQANFRIIPWFRLSKSFQIHLSPHLLTPHSLVTDSIVK
jgi:hypothetical protein